MIGSRTVPDHGIDRWGVLKGIALRSLEEVPQFWYRIGVVKSMALFRTWSQRISIEDIGRF